MKRASMRLSSRPQAKVCLDKSTRINCCTRVSCKDNHSFCLLNFRLRSLLSPLVSLQLQAWQPPNCSQHLSNLINFLAKSSRTQSHLKQSPKLFPSKRCPPRHSAQALSRLQLRPWLFNRCQTEVLELSRFKLCQLNLVSHWPRPRFCLLPYRHTQAPPSLWHIKCLRSWLTPC